MKIILLTYSLLVYNLTNVFSPIFLFSTRIFNIAIKYVQITIGTYDNSNNDRELINKDKKMYSQLIPTYFSLSIMSWFLLSLYTSIFYQMDA